MKMQCCRLGGMFLMVWLACAGFLALPALADEPWMPTPPRLGYVDGEVSHWRSGADAWVRARANLALAEGDALYAGPDANFEVQFGPRSFVRADEQTEVALVQLEAQRTHFKVTGGRASFDLRSLGVGETLEVSTPNAVFIVEHPGYYRVEVEQGETRLITRRAGEATLITSDGRSMAVYPSEEIVVTAANPAKVATYAAPAPDGWDRWNDARSERVAESISARYVSSGIYGVEELDHYGHWRVVATYGAVWVPYGVPPGWAPYSTGYWVWDPYYEWTWIDDAPWGWAPFHYGRWVYIDGFWAWAPGPVVRRPAYAPALVAFVVRDGDVSVRLSVGLPGVWWVALSWGEPVLPWWGPSYRRWKPWWGGWGGPRVVNNVVIRQTTIVNVRTIVYRNASHPRAILSLPPDKFGRERAEIRTETRYRANEFEPVRRDLPIKPSRASLSGGAPKAIEPPREIVSRPVVSTRAPRDRAPALEDAPRVRVQTAPESRYVVPPARRIEQTRTLQRPPFGAEAGPERAPDPRPPRYEDIRKSAPVPDGTRPESRSREMPQLREAPAVTPRTQPPSGMMTPRERAEPAPQREEVRREENRRETIRREELQREEKRERPLPGQPASQTYRGRGHDDDRAQPR